MKPTNILREVHQSFISSHNVKRNKKNGETTPVTLCNCLSNLSGSGYARKVTVKISQCSIAATLKYFLFLPQNSLHFGDTVANHLNMPISDFLHDAPILYLDKNCLNNISLFFWPTSRILAMRRCRTCTSAPAILMAISASLTAVGP